MDFHFGLFPPERRITYGRRTPKATRQPLFSRDSFICSSEFEHVFDELFKCFGDGVVEDNYKPAWRTYSETRKVNGDEEDGDDNMDSPCSGGGVDSAGTRVATRHAEGLGRVTNHEDAAPPMSRRVWSGTGDPRDDQPPPMPKSPIPIDDQPPIKKPKSLLEMLEDGDKQLEKILGNIVDKKLAERNIKLVPCKDDEEYAEEYDPEPKKDISVFVANRLTFLIQTLHPIVFDTSTIETVGNTMTIAVNEAKTYPRIGTRDDLGYITCQINNSPEVAKEIEEFLEDTGYSNIYCFPDRIVGRDGVGVWAVKFVMYKGK